MIPALEDIDTSLPTLDVAIPPVSTPDDSIPDWIKQSPVITDDITVSAPVGSAPILEVTPPESERLPDWLMSSLQTDTTPDTIVAETAPALTPDIQTKSENLVKPVKKVTKKPKTTTIKKDKKTP